MPQSCIQNTTCETFVSFILAQITGIYCRKISHCENLCEPNRAHYREKLLLPMKDIGVTFEQRRSVDRIY